MTGAAVNASAARSRRAGGEHSPLLEKANAAAAKSLAIDIRVASPTLRAVEAPAVFETKRAGTSTYGTLPLEQSAMFQQKRGVNEPECDPLNGHACSNQSETESDSDASCGSSTTQTMVLPPSILRIRSTDHSYEKKTSSVEFAIDVIDTDDEDDEYEGDENDTNKPISNRRKSCAARCMPRRLTEEEKVELYRVRPDLDQTPMSLPVRDWEEMRRRRQRRAVFSMLGGTLTILMLVVMYYVFSQV